MEGDSNQEKSSIDPELQTVLLVNNHHDHKGGMITMPFIIVNEAFDRVASYGLMPNMIFYLMEVYHMDVVTGTSILSICLLSIGSGCIRPCSIAFGADQLKHHPTLNNQRLIDSYFNWYYASLAISTVVAFTVMVYIQDQLGWQVMFAVTVLIMACSALMFLLGSSLYVKVSVSESVLSGPIQVLIVAFKNHRIHLLPDDRYYHSSETDQVELTDNLRFLNKACVVRDLVSNQDSSRSDPWSVSTVENVESLKSNMAVDMSAMWLVPQYALLGLAEAFNAIGQMEFYYSELSKSMSSIAIAMFMVSMAISGLVGSLLINVVDTVTTKGGNISWLSSDINEGHVDYYYCNRTMMIEQEEYTKWQKPFH
ncbi:hypothetical protein L1987_59343 [Smallanthus sonchifolius]|uniref:Uncharacterized protein n=1 Tax=Smallanthus sonchifolius TaxID=185202 RepID=A0ACB9D4Z2_9ASTR|nr:hypothetical protein L1987_59343 [Smallanthus sonchifolius]